MSDTVRTIEPSNVGRYAKKSMVNPVARSAGASAARENQKAHARLQTLLRVSGDAWAHFKPIRRDPG